MKKTVAFIIGIIYILSMVFVGFQLKIQIFNPITYVESITCINDDVTIYTLEEAKANSWVQETDDFDCIIRLGYDNKISYPYSFELKFRCSPDNATKKTLTFSYDESNEIATSESYTDSSCLVNFSRGGKFNLTVYANDKIGGASIKLMLDAKRSGIL